MCRAGGVWELSVLSSQFCIERKMAHTQKVCFFLKEELTFFFILTKFQILWWAKSLSPFIHWTSQTYEAETYPSIPYSVSCQCKSLHPGSKVGPLSNMTREQ